jgi:2-oxoglutarate ferredoxin oxidoreductase subunit gamma
MRKEIRIAGFGGQGVGLAGYILGKAFAIYDGLEAVMTQSYGPEARGGASYSSIVISDHDIAYPFVERPDFLIALSQEAYTKFQPAVVHDGLIITDRDLVEPLNDQNHLAIPATQIAEDLGNRIAANMVMLGYFSAASRIVSIQAINQSVESSVRPHTTSLNLEAVKMGFVFAVEMEVGR